MSPDADLWAELPGERNAKMGLRCEDVRKGVSAGGIGKSLGCELPRGSQACLPSLPAPQRLAHKRPPSLLDVGCLSKQPEE